MSSDCTKSKEQWQDVLGHEGAYQVSTWGRVRSRDRIVKRRRQGNMFFKGIILKPQSIKKSVQGNYVRVKLGRDFLLVHRIVWTAFKGTIPSNLQINHKDCNRQNNRLDNLELVTAQGNSNHARQCGRLRWVRGADHYSAKLTEEDVKTIRASYVPRKMSYQKLADMFGVDITNIHCIVKRHTWRHVP